MGQYYFTGFVLSIELAREFGMEIIEGCRLCVNFAKIKHLHF
jgi:hypothetical protein